MTPEERAKELAEFHLWACKRDLMYSIDWGAQGFWEDVEIISAAPTECYYEKKVGSLPGYTERWEQHFKEKLTSRPRSHE